MEHTADAFFRAAGMDDLADMIPAVNTDAIVDENVHLKNTVYNLTMYLNVATRCLDTIDKGLWEWLEAEYDGMPGYNPALTREDLEF